MRWTLIKPFIPISVFIVSAFIASSFEHLGLAWLALIFIISGSLFASFGTYKLANDYTGRVSRLLRLSAYGFAAFALIPAGLYIAMMIV
jgi:hypothetical protein